MTKIDIFSGFLGAGKTTLIKKLIREAFAGEKLVLIENEFGEIGVDGGFLQEAGIQVTEMNSGCICCSLVGDFRAALHKVVEEYHPDRILIEPSGVGKLSDVTRAVESVAESDEVQLESFVTVADVNKVKLYMKNFGEFYNDQISHASTIILSRTGSAKEDKVAAAVEMLREKNPKAVIITTDWDSLTGTQIVEAALQTQDSFMAELLEQARADSLAHEAEHHHHHHDDDDDDHECCHHDHEEHEHHHHDDDDDHECCHHDHEEHEHHHHDDDDDDHECCHHNHEGHEHHHHDDDDDHECCHHDHEEHEHHHHDDDDDHECCHHDHEEHEHHHHYDENGVCSCGHHHHHADEVFTSWGKETARKFTQAELEFALNALDSGDFGAVLRAKGIVAGEDGWFEFDYVPGEHEIRRRGADVIGRLCVIGSELKEAALAELFKI